MTNKRTDHEPVNDPRDVPAFASEQEEATFWATHEIGDALLDRMTSPAEGDLPAARPRTKPISLRVEEDLLDAVKGLAAEASMPYQTLLKHLVAEALKARVEAGASQRPSRQAVTSPARPVAMRGVVRRPSPFPRVAGHPTVCRHSDAIRARGNVYSYSG